MTKSSHISSSSYFLFSLGWPYPPSAPLIQPPSHKPSPKKASSFNSYPQAIVSIHQPQKSGSATSKNDALTFHLHTHHHHHIHNSNSSPSLKTSSSPAKTTAIPLASEKPSRSLTPLKEQPVAAKTVLPLSVNNVVRQEQQAIPPATGNRVLDLAASGKTNGNQENGTIRRTTRRKSSPVKRSVTSATKPQR